ncbi:L,D-transpeptidase family protein [Bacillus rubiinfantis]|uniref:L,D-transpeptidase family protein n=1 Tax=Bacillus rubiinfantis TaxID=1499680 RepID=UPI0005A5D02E|nr:L,D-transpeptidase family protein [Bacillus rubiinfantis]
MKQAVQESVGERSRSDVHSKKQHNKWKFITFSTITIVVIILAGISYYQATHFNQDVSINGTNVGGLTAEKALAKLQSAVIKNDVYVGEKLIHDGQDMKMGFTNQDLPEVKKIIKRQWSFFPSFKKENYSMMPDELAQYRSRTLKKEVEEKLMTMNKSLKAPVDAQAKLVEGKLVITKSSNGEQYDVKGLMKAYEKQEYNSDIKLKPLFLQPVKEDSAIVKNEQKKLEELLQRTVEYKVQNKVHSLNASELIQNAAVTKDMKVKVDSNEIEKKVAEINDKQSTLNKYFKFRTHSGRVISVKGEGYGWALDVEKETAQIRKAFVDSKSALSAKHIVGNGWNGEGFGYNNTANGGIGDTYAEVSIAQQHAWIYRNGKLVLSWNVVTGKHITGEDTSKGVWYILYKRQQYTLRGSAVGKGDYAVKVDYWAPFTNSGQGFHDASWRTNWSSNAYLTAGSGGCVNTPPSIMRTVYNNLNTYDPVVIY